jgi:hypothetical protein
LNGLGFGGAGCERSADDNPLNISKDWVVTSKRTTNENKMKLSRKEDV